MSVKNLSKKPKNAKERQEFADGLFHLKNLLLKSKYIADNVSPKISNRSVLMGREMFKRVTDMYNEMTFKTEVTLVTADELEEDDEQMDYNSSENSFTEEEEEDDDDKASSHTKIPYEVKLKTVKLADSHPKWSINTLRKESTNLLKNKSQLEQWKKDVKKGGTRFDKLNIINKNVYDRFLRAKTKELDPVKMNSLIREWALDEATKFNDKNFKFKASDSWVLNFKTTHGISHEYILKSEVEQE